MAIKTITQYTDDLDGSSEGVETVKFGLWGAGYEIDLTKANQDRLHDALRPYLDKARKDSSGAAAPRRASSRPASSPSGHDAKDVRRWATEAGISVPPRGRIPGSVIEQYQAAHS